MDKDKLGLLHKSFHHYKFVSYGRRSQVIVASDDNA